MYFLTITNNKNNKIAKDFDMNSVKEILHNTIESLNDDEARLILEYTKRLKEQKDVSLTLASLADDPTFDIPSEVNNHFPIVKPIKCDGIPASELLIKDRR
jgi:hypothetical protein